MLQYLAYSSVALKEGMAFRINFFTSILGGFFRLLLLVSVWKAIYIGQGSLQGYGESEILFYIVVAAAVSAGGMLSVDAILGAKSETGDVVVDMIRPVSLPWSFFFFSLGGCALRLWTKGLPTLLVGLIMIGHVPSVEAAQLAAFLLLIMGGNFLHYWLNLGVASFTYRTKSAYGVSVFWRAGTAFLAGAIVPVAFYPELLRDIILWTPFPSMLYTPIRVLMGDSVVVGGLSAFYSEHLQVAPVTAAVLEQLSWILVVLPATLRVYRWNEASADIQGG